MVSAGTAYKLALDVDRSLIPWFEIPKAQTVFVIGANIGECYPITSDNIWRSRDNGGKLIVADPRLTPISRNADLFLRLRPGTDLALLSGMLHVVLRDNLQDDAFIVEHTSGFEAVKASVARFDSRTAGEMTGVPPESIEKAAHWFAKADRAIATHSRGLEHQSKGVEKPMPDGFKTARKEEDTLWRDEFSFSKADERYVSRRQLAKFLTLASLGMFVGNTWIFVRSWLRKAPVYSRSFVAGIGEIPLGGVKLFQYSQPGEQCIMMRTADDSYVACSQKCTHLSCAAFHSPEQNCLECPCHQGYFSVRMARCYKGRLPVRCRGLCWSVRTTN